MGNCTNGIVSIMKYSRIKHPRKKKSKNTNPYPKNSKKSMKPKPISPNGPFGSMKSSDRLTSAKRAPKRSKTRVSRPISMLRAPAHTGRISSSDILLLAVNFTKTSINVWSSSRKGLDMKRRKWICQSLVVAYRAHHDHSGLYS
jgi:hypothetical protein